MYLLACGADSEMPPGFEVPFRSTAAYLNMTFERACYGQADDSGPTPLALREAAEFGEIVFS